MWKSPAIILFLLVILLANSALARPPLSATQVGSLEQAAEKRASIIKEVRHELTLLPQYSLFDWLEFEVRPNDSVVLRGQVRGLTLKADAEAAVKRIEGVTQVVNQIENLPLSPNDDQIRRAVYRTVYAEDGPLFRYAIEVVPSIHIIVKNGIVTLKGVVDTPSDSEFADLKVRSVPDIFEVKNELQIKAVARE